MNLEFAFSIISQKKGWLLLKYDCLLWVLGVTLWVLPYSYCLT